MPITMMCRAEDPGAVLDGHWTERVRVGQPDARPIYMQTTHHGLVLSTYERNGYSDSDFVAVVWDPEAGAPRHIEYASTRGWSYPNHAEEDATPEVRAAFDAYMQRVREQESERARQREAVTPRVGKRVRILPNKGKAKDRAGQVGTVFWMQEQRSQYGTWSRGWRLGVRFDDGARVFLAAERAEVLS